MCRDLNCTRCGETKKCTEFVPRKDVPRGYSSHCKECRKTDQNKRYNNDKSKWINKEYTKEQLINCVLCGSLKAENYEIKNSSRPSYCKGCKNLLIKCKLYNITYPELKKLYIEQDHKCKICKEPEDSLSKGLVVDHDHNTGKVRGLLCGRCNTGLGLFRDNILFLKEAQEYISNNK